MVSLWGVASAQVVDLAGPWILEYPQGKGVLTLTGTGTNPPSYYGNLVLPHPSYPNGMACRVKMLSAPEYVVPGNNISFQVDGPGINFLVLNVSSSSSGIAWVIPHGGADVHLLNLSNIKAQAHR